MSALSGLNVLSRRRVLKLSLSAGGLLALGGAGGLWALRGRAPEVAGLHQLSAHEHRTFAALAEAAFPRGRLPRRSPSPRRNPSTRIGDDRGLLVLYDGNVVLRLDANGRKTWETTLATATLGESLNALAEGNGGELYPDPGGYRAHDAGLAPPELLLTSAAQLSSPAPRSL